MTATMTTTAIDRKALRIMLLPVWFVVLPYVAIYFLLRADVIGGYWLKSNLRELGGFVYHTVPNFLEVTFGITKTGLTVGFSVVAVLWFFALIGLIARAK